MGKHNVKHYSNQSGFNGKTLKTDKCKVLKLPHYVHILLLNIYYVMLSMQKYVVF